MIRGRFVTLEGPEGAGKSTLATALAAALQRRGLTVTTTREPGGTPLGERLRDVLLARDGIAIPPAAETMLMFAARAAHVDQVIRPALGRGHWVLCDRFTDASWAYQGAGRGVAGALIEVLAEAAHPGLVPDRTLLLDIPVAEGLARARARGGADRFERESLEFMERVRAAYLMRAAAEPERFRVLDARANPTAVLDAALTALLPLAEGR